MCKRCAADAAGADSPARAAAQRINAQEKIARMEAAAQAEVCALPVIAFAKPVECCQHLIVHGFNGRFARPGESLSTFFSLSMVSMVDSQWSVLVVPG